jgi:hypothetical protein
MSKIRIGFGFILAIVVASIVIAAVAGIIYTASNPAVDQPPAKEYRVWHHDNDTVSTVATNYGVFIITDKDLWNSLELNHTYTCEETYSNVSLKNCTEIIGG